MFPKVKKFKKVIYLDNAAATPLDPQVKKAMEPFLNEKFGNPSSLYTKGREAKKAVEDSRASIARIINARNSEIIFTAGGTESVNLAIFGIARNNPIGSHIIASSIEHHCVINSFQALQKEGYKTSLVGVNSEGLINIEKLKKAVRPDTILISVMYANNEIGTIQPIAEIGKWLKGENSKRLSRRQPQIIFHTDACQAAGFLDLNVDKLGVDLMSVNGSKIYGPKQTGLLYIKSGTAIKPLIYGGGQENEIRSGTENVSGIVGLAKAFELTQKIKGKNNKQLFNLSVHLTKEIKKLIPNTIINGADLTPSVYRLPNNINLTFKDVEGEALMLYLDSYGICVSTSSACSTGSAEPSHVLLAIGRTEEEAKSSIRMTLGKNTNKKEIEYTVKVLSELVKELRKIK